MNLAILIGHFPPGAFGGAELQAERWAARLAARHRVTVVTRRDPADQSPREERPEGYRVVRLPVSGVPLWRSAADVARIVGALRRLDPAPDVLLCFQTFLSGVAGTVAQQVGLGPAVVWIRGEAEYRFDQSRVHAAVSPWVWRRCAGVLVQSEENRVGLLRALEGRAPQVARHVARRLEVVPNGLDLPAWAPSTGDAVLGVGRLIQDKGMDTLIEAAALAGRRVILAGEGPERAALEQLAAARGVDCRFVGFADRDELSRLYRESAVFVLAARRGEGLPNVVLEAMAHARPVVATACAGTRDLVVDGKNGWLVPPDDPMALAAVLERLSTEPEVAAAAGARARSDVERFAWDRVVPRLESVLERWRRPS